MSKAYEIKPMEPVYCEKCGSEQPCRIEINIGFFESRGRTFAYNMSTAKCMKCGTELCVPWVDDVNAETRRKAVEYADKMKYLTGKSE